MSGSLRGSHWIAGKPSQTSRETFQASSPTTGKPLEPSFPEATESEVNQALEAADKAFQSYRKETPQRRAIFLRLIADELEALGDDLIERAVLETALPPQRITGERGRTCAQLRMFAELIEEGSWVNARIDHALPERKPQARPDLRRMLIPLGPVVVFGASNFPLAFSVPGGDTASALAAGCPVVAKGHPAHPGTSELAARAILSAADKAGMPEGVFSLLHGASHDLGLRLVRHSKTKAVAFTGSLRGGRALFDAAAARPDPIPVYAEMGSINPVFVLPGALEQDCDALAQGLVQSVTLGVGQFCTNPGLVVGLMSPSWQAFMQSSAAILKTTVPQPMLHAGIHAAFLSGAERIGQIPGVEVIQATQAAHPSPYEAPAFLFTSSVSTFLNNPTLSEEVFGPSTILTYGANDEDLYAVAQALDGHLTATIHGTEEDLERYESLIDLLEQKVGRLIFNGFPTGVEVSPAMNHGGPYPASTDVRTTSVGTAAIDRFARPICYQNFPPRRLPAELQDENSRGIWRLVNGTWTKD